MSKKSGEFYSDYSNEDFDLLGCKYIGEGHNGIIYRMKDGRIIKIFKDKEDGVKEYKILKSVKGNKYFPKVYECGENYMIRDYVSGKGLKDYIRQNSMDRILAMSVIRLLEEFKKLGFTKMDIRCKDIFVQSDGNLMIIDPKSMYTKVKKYPHRLMIGLNKVGALECFENVLMEERPYLYRKWIIEGRELEKNEDKE